jgi:hypothetical protein
MRKNLLKITVTFSILCLSIAMIGCGRNSNLNSANTKTFMSKSISTTPTPMETIIPSPTVVPSIDTSVPTPTVEVTPTSTPVPTAPDTSNTEAVVAPSPTTVKTAQNTIVASSTVNSTSEPTPTVIATPTPTIATTPMPTATPTPLHEQDMTKIFPSPNSCEMTKNTSSEMSVTDNCYSFGNYNYVEFNLNGKYTEIKGSVYSKRFNGQVQTKINSSVVSFLTDGNTIATFNIQDTQPAQAFDINVVNVQKIRITFNGTSLATFSPITIK